LVLLPISNYNNDYSQSSSSSVFDDPGSVLCVGGGIMAETRSIAPLTDDSGLFAPEIPYKHQSPSSELYSCYEAILSLKSYLHL
jgi:hypothetical protein